MYGRHGHGSVGTGPVALWGMGPQAKEEGREGGVTPGVCQAVEGRWPMEGTEPEFPDRPLTMLLDAGLPFRRQGVRKWLAGNRCHEYSSKELAFINML